MDKVLLGSLIVFAITTSLFFGYWFGANQELYNQTKIAIWDWCADANHFKYCRNECNYFDEQCLKKALNSPPPNP